MKKGFTLIELLAVIIILAIVAVIATPMVLDVVDDAKNSARDSKLKMYADSAKLKAEGNYFSNNGKIDGEIDVSTINNNSTTCAKAYYVNGGVYLGNCTIDGVSGLYYVNGKIETISTNYNNAISGVKVLYKDASGANYPNLFNNMVAVKYDGTNWLVADTTTEWYDYDKKEWANAVILNDGVSKNEGDTLNIETEVSQMYVWIPRYKYTIFNGNNSAVPEQEINITFENEINSTGTVTCHDSITSYSTEAITNVSEICSKIANNVSTYTHPTFTFGTTQLTGIWVGKFENSAVDVSSSTEQDILIKPNVKSWRSSNISTYFESIKKISNKFKINGDTHLIKNMDWGAVAYLTQSRYGRCTAGTCVEVSINNSSGNYTGRSAGVPGASDVSTTTEGNYVYNELNGMLASTTGNIYGIYDMAGGKLEYTMGNSAKTSTLPIVGNNDTYTAGFSGKYYDGTDAISTYDYPEFKYVDLYSFEDSSYTHSRGKLGDATKETLSVYEGNAGGWYNDSSYSPGGTSWSIRGGGATHGAGAGIFTFSNCAGYAGGASSRSVITAK